MKRMVIGFVLLFIAMSVSAMVGEEPFMQLNTFGGTDLIGAGRLFDPQHAYLYNSFDYNPIDLDRYVDFLSTSEYIHHKQDNDRKNTQFASLNKIAVMYPPYFGVEAGFRTLFAERESSFSNQVFSLGAGIPKAEYLRLMLFYSKYEERVDDGIDQSNKQDGIRFELQKDVLSKDQRLSIGFEAIINDTNNSFGNMPYGFFMNNFDFSNLEFVPKNRLIVYTYATNASDKYDEPIYMNGTSPAVNALMNTSKTLYLLGLRYVQDTYVKPNTTKDDVYKDLSAEAGLNLTQYAGLDLQYQYKAYEYSNDDDTNLKILKAGLRFNLLDLDVLRVQTMIEYKQQRDSTSYHELNLGASLILRLAKYTSIRGFVKLDNDWEVNKDASKIESKDMFFGGVITIRL